MYVHMHVKEIYKQKAEYKRTCYRCAPEKRKETKEYVEDSLAFREATKMIMVCALGVG